MAISVTDLDPLHYVTAERVASLRRLYDEAAELVDETVPDLATGTAIALRESLPDVRVLLMALEQLTAKRE